MQGRAADGSAPPRSPSSARTGTCYDRTGTCYDRTGTCYDRRTTDGKRRTRDDRRLTRRGQTSCGDAMRRWLVGLAITSVAATIGGCESSAGVDSDGANHPTLSAPRNGDGTIADDRSLCEHKNRKDVEVTETAGPGSIQPNVRRVYKVVGTGANSRKTLVCREVDTDLNGYKDTVRFYNDEGQSKEERADTNGDGKIDTWNLFSKGRLAEVKLDHNHDGKPDEWKTYVEGKLYRIKRDANFNGDPDTWEMYRGGRLERMGVDLDGDKRVDRWDHDTEWRRKLEAAERKKREEAEEKKKKELERRRKEAEEAAAADEAAGG